MFEQRVKKAMQKRIMLGKLLMNLKQIQGLNAKLANAKGRTSIGKSSEQQYDDQEV